MRLISVTTALKPFADFSRVHPDRLEAAARRGTETHQACAAYARRLPVFCSPEAEPYFESFRNWFDRYVKRALFVEAEFSDPATYGIIGHIDIVAELTDERVVVIDYKNPVAESPTWKAQIAAYCYLVRPVVGEADGMALQLSPNGKAAVARHYRRTAEDFAAFVSALTAYRYFKEAA